LAFFQLLLGITSETETLGYAHIMH